MNKKIFYFIFLLLVIINIPLAKSQSGFYGRKNEISWNFFDITGFEYTIEYKRMLGKHIGIWGMFSPMSMRNGDLSNQINEKDSLYDQVIGKMSGSGYNYGIGLIFNTQLTGLPLPVGNYFGVNYVHNNSSFEENITKGKVDKLKYELDGHSVRLVLGRCVAISPRWMLDFNFNIGRSWGIVSETNKKDSLPMEIYPVMNSFGLEPNYHRINAASWNYNSFLLRVNIKIGFLF